MDDGTHDGLAKAIKDYMGAGDDFEICSDGMVSVRHTEWRPVGSRGLTELYFQRRFGTSSRHNDFLEPAVMALFNDLQFRKAIHK